jgi:hypothetical protein
VGVVERRAELKRFEGYSWPLLLGDPGKWAGLPITEKPEEKPEEVKESSKNRTGVL